MQTAALMALAQAPPSSIIMSRLLHSLFCAYKSSRPPSFSIPWSFAVHLLQSCLHEASYILATSAEQQMPSRWFPAARRCSVRRFVEPLHIFSPLAIIQPRIPCCCSFTIDRYEQGEMPPLATPEYNDLNLFHLFYCLAMIWLCCYRNIVVAATDCRACA
jgi:hypothetical protein